MFEVDKVGGRWRALQTGGDVGGWWRIRGQEMVIILEVGS